MNIKEHIQAGHYPVDEKGRALVPMRNGATATVYTVQHGDPWPIAGSFKDDGFINGFSLVCWQADGRISSSSEAPRDLMPPALRKVRVVAWALVGKQSGSVFRCVTDEEEAREYPSIRDGTWRVVPLVGEYEL